MKETKTKAKAKIIENLDSAISTLAVRAASAKPLDAMQLTQAAQNAASTIVILQDSEDR